MISLSSLLSFPHQLSAQRDIKSSKGSFIVIGVAEAEHNAEAKEEKEKELHDLKPPFRGGVGVENIIRAYTLSVGSHCCSAGEEKEHLLSRRE